MKASGSGEPGCTPDDVDEAVQARMRRNRIVRSPGHRFAVVVEESVLRYLPGNSDIMAAEPGPGWGSRYQASGPEAS